MESGDRACIERELETCLKDYNSLDDYEKDYISSIKQELIESGYLINSQIMALTAIYARLMCERIKKDGYG